MMKKRLVITLLAICLTGGAVFAQIAPLDRIEPACWWVGMKHRNLQLIVHGQRIADRTVSLEYPGVTLTEIHKVENPNYLFLDLHIAPEAQAGNFNIRFTRKGSKDISYSYELKKRNEQQPQGVTSQDLLYLIMPDRFANGDPKNDVVKGMQETALNRDSMYYRHGGDIQGIIDHLDYLQDLGVTALWLNPVLENDQPSASYHGYANTEHYKIDRRYGTNELYRQLASELHKRGMKLIKDLVHNHIGSQHWTMKDLPSKDWVHQWPVYTKSNFREQTQFDPYAAKADKQLMTDGWFDKHMPDINQANSYVRNYFTQSHIWWIEYTGLDGFRLDTYSYNDAGYMQEWGKVMKEEYPTLSFFGETFVKGMPNQVFFTEGNTIHRGFDSELPGVTDFQLLWAITDALTQKPGWDEGVARLYNTLASDFMYKDPMQQVIFLDNHDLSRFFSVVGEDMRKYKSAMAWLLTTRGIPQLYYGAEILMKNFCNPDGLVRSDFPGGWPGDRVNKFTAGGRTAPENEIFDYVKKLANYRKQHAVLQTGKTMQYVPENGVYVYFRYNEEETVMVIMNGSDKDATVETKRFAERLNGVSTGEEINTGTNIDLRNNIQVSAYTTHVISIKHS
ncbi:glycoside hydrolase family 13 protein [Chitinophaga pendula]|nr:glycoside hydrolase family 13 protein [Chitinophaga pendula]